RAAAPNLFSASTKRPLRPLAEAGHSRYPPSTSVSRRIVIRSRVMSAAMANSSTKRRVLVVDDEENVTHLVSSALRFDGFETMTADSGTAALHKIAEYDPDLVVLDVMMPGRDGFGVLQELRA